MHDASDIDCHGVFPIAEGQRRGASDRDDPGVGHRYVNAAESLRCRAHRFHAVGFLSGVARHRQPPCFRRHLFKGRGPAAGHHDLGAGLVEASCNRRAYSGAAARDDGHLVLELSSHFSPPLVNSIPLARVASNGFAPVVRHGPAMLGGGPARLSRRPCSRKIMGVDTPC